MIEPKEGGALVGWEQPDEAERSQDDQDPWAPGGGVQATLRAVGFSILEASA